MCLMTTDSGSELFLNVFPKGSQLQAECNKDSHSEAKSTIEKDNIKMGIFEEHESDGRNEK
jgi:hypothetical protein